MARLPQYNGFFEAMVKIVQQTISKAEESGENLHPVILAYRVTPTGPVKLNSAETITQHTFRALSCIKQHLSAQLTTSRKTTRGRQ